MAGFFCVTLSPCVEAVWGECWVDQLSPSQSVVHQADRDRLCCCHTWPRDTPAAQWRHHEATGANLESIRSDRDSEGPGKDLL